MKVEPERLKSVLGITNVTFIPGRSSLAVVDSTLSGQPPAFEAANRDAMMHRRTEGTNLALQPNQIGIDNFQFTPSVLSVSAGTAVTWINKDDTPHLVVSTQNKFASGVLDEDQRFTVTLTEPGTYDYFCSIHPKMQGQLVVR
jgi:plastocyanin